MSRTITAMFDNRSEADAAREQLRSELGADAQIIDQSTLGSDTTSTNGESRGFWAELKDVFVAHEDRPTYEEGVRRGQFMLCAAVSEDQADRACAILDEGSSVDLDQRQEQWRSDGWSGDSERQQTTSRETLTNQASTSERGKIVDEQTIPIVEEQLRVGKREVERGGARVRSYVEERPVTETVNLREEHVNVERRPVDQPISATELDRGKAFEDRTIEMRESAEEAIIGKDARVTEEVVVSKTADQRTEEINETVRNTKVEVEDALGERTDAGEDRLYRPDDSNQR